MGKVQASNLLCGLTSGSTNFKKCKSRSIWRGLYHVTYFYNFEIPLHLWNGQPTNLMYGLTPGLQNKKCKSRSKGACPALRDLLLYIWDPLYTSGMGKARDFKVGVRIDLQACKPKKIPN